MLDTDTKRRIDTARDILVGKVPDPKSQVEQITIALIYKFMDDMDAESEELGGKRKFFTGDFARYGWAKLMAPSLGGHEMLGLYGEGIAKMPENPGIPALFRDIFKNAYLPYRDPETLKAFLKIIDEFSYDHSERLGDAFEYLLSVLGSQGDAGQFRTPRHIIDFMVEVLAPQKHETILDPACGTAGFLISAYKHILRTNTDAKGSSTLTPDEKGRLAKNFKGFDISPDMVRLSLVNLYLHGFTDPHIYEYDTLTSDERWNEFADVILANPPFMSPKGGIKPHKRFSIQAKRSEVLFVDYMAEHLTPTGRAAIIVPEGIIFQSQTAYKELRRMLVENSLVAVVSLPAGCFNPYSGVKTSILILDKSLARQSNTVAFFKVENDGFGLGAQRRAIEKNDLPQVQVELADYLQALRIKTATESIFGATSTAQIVQKEKIAANGDYNLSAERYREGGAKTNIFPLVKIEEVCSTSSGGTPLSGKTEYYEGGTIPWLRSGEVAQGEVFRSELFITEEGLKNSSAKIFTPNTVLVAMYGATAGEVGILRFKAATNQAVCGITPDERLRPDFLYLILKCNKPALIRLAGGGAQPNISQKIIREFKIPLPPLEMQKEIVAEIEGYQKVINGARAVLDHYRPHIPIHPNWPMGILADVCTLISGQHIDKEDYNTNRVGVDYLTGPSDFGLKHPVATRWTFKPKVFAERGDILMTVKGSGLGSVNLLSTEKAAISRQLMAIRVRDADPEFIYVVLLAKFDHIQSLGGGAAIPGITREHVLGLEVPLPSLALQKAIVAEIEVEQTVVAGNRELITRFEQKIQATLARIWGSEVPLRASPPNATACHEMGEVSHQVQCLKSVAEAPHRTVVQVLQEINTDASR
ncbi:MAG: N-6 DNA methylase [Gammaproteobacteria bacterium]|nr:N-6 DNA methylase [Gammaproteobacteria bacterium]